MESKKRPSLQKASVKGDDKLKKARKASDLAPDTATPLAPDTATPLAPDTATPLAPNTATPLAPNTATPLAIAAATPGAAHADEATATASSVSVRYPEPDEIEDAFRNQPPPPPTRKNELNHNIVDKLHRIEEVIFFSLVGKGLMVGIAEDAKDKKAVEVQVRSQLMKHEASSQVHLTLLSCRRAQLSHGPQCRLRMRQSDLEERSTGPAESVAESVESLAQKLSPDIASIGVIIRSFQKQSEKTDPNDKMWIYLVSVAHLFPFWKFVGGRKHVNGRFYRSWSFMCGGKSSVEEPCMFGCREATPGCIVPGIEGACHKSRGSYTPQIGEGVGDIGEIKEAVDILLVPIGETKQWESMMLQTNEGQGLIKVEYYPFSKTPDESKIDQDLGGQIVCMYSTMREQLLSGEIKYPVADARLTDHDGKFRYYKNVVLYSVPSTEKGDSGSALFVYLKDPSTPGRKTLYLVGFHVAFPAERRVDQHPDQAAAIKWDGGLSAAVRAESSIDKVIPSIHSKDAFIPVQLRDQLLQEFLMREAQLPRYPAIPE